MGKDAFPQLQTQSLASLSGLFPRAFILSKCLGSVWDVNIQAQIHIFFPPSVRTDVPAVRKRANTGCIACGRVQVTQFGSIKSCLAFQVIIATLQRIA